MFRNINSNQQQETNIPAEENQDTADEKSEGFARLAHIHQLRSTGMYSVRLFLPNDDSQSVPSSTAPSPSRAVNLSHSTPQSPQNYYAVNTNQPPSSRRNSVHLSAAPAG